jgi:hypothetical protein
LTKGVRKAYIKNIGCLFYDTENIVKDKAILVQAWIFPEGSRNLRFPDFKTVGILRW